MVVMVIKQGRYIDTRDGRKYTLVKWNSVFLVFQGGLQVSMEEFNEFFELSPAQ